jgi:multidrug efflux system membrane fusion protein
MLPALVANWIKGMSKNIRSAAIIAVVLLLWLGSGLILDGSETQEHPTIAAQTSAPENVQGLSRVRAEVITSTVRTRYLVLRGRTESKRMVQVKAEIAGKLLSRPAERGERVRKGDLLCEVAVDDRAVAVTQARAALEDAELNYKGSRRLKEQGLQSETAIASSAARLEAARAQLQREVLNLERTRIVAPFGGVVEEVHMNTGDYAVPGAVCVTLIDLNPMLVRADVSEGDIESLALGDAVVGSITSGRQIQGVVSFIGMRSDPATRTYPVEITVENADYSIRSGLTVSVSIALNELPAHQISPALFTLSDSGEIGVHTLDASNQVVFREVHILEDGPDGVWVAGLQETTKLITVGQESVSAGELVEPVYRNDPRAEVRQP